MLLTYIKLNFVCMCVQYQCVILMIMYFGLSCIRAEREDKNHGRISASQNSEIFVYSFGVF